MRRLLRDVLVLALRGALSIGFLLALAQPSNAVTLVNSLVLEVDENNQVTVVSGGSTVPMPFNTVVRAGSYPFINGWGVSSGEANWFDSVAHVLRLNSSGVFVPVDNRLSGSFVTGSVTITGSTALGAALRQSLGAGTSSFISTSAQGTIPYEFSGTVTIAPLDQQTVISGVQLEVDSTDAVTVVSSGSHIPFGDVGDAGDFGLAEWLGRRVEFRHPEMDRRGFPAHRGCRSEFSGHARADDWQSRERDPLWPDASHRIADARGSAAERTR